MVINMLTNKLKKSILRQTKILGKNLKYINTKSNSNWLLFVGFKKTLFALVIVIMSCLFIDVHALTLGTTKGTTDPNSYIVQDKGLLTINNVSDNDSLIAIKILDVYYNETSNVVTYEFTYSFKKFLAQSDIYKNLTISDYYNLTSGDITSGSTQTTSTLDKLVSKYATYIYDNHWTNNWELSISKKTATAELESGVYLVIPYGAERVYAVMVGNLTPTVIDGTWQIADATINAKASDPTVIKYLGKIGEVSGSYSIGDEVPCIMVATVPLFPTNASYIYYLLGDVVDPIFDLPTFEKFIVKDGDKVLTTQSDGTVIDENGNIVAIILIPDSTWSNRYGGNVVTIQIDPSYLTSNVVTVNYSLILNENAVVSTSGNENTAGLIMQTAVYSPNERTWGYQVYTTIYTYGIDLLAYKKGDKSTLLSDMTFDVYKDSALTQKVGTITTDSSGKGTLAGVAEGTYYLKNTKTVSGYNLATTTAMKVKISGAVDSDTDGYYKVEIEVPEISALPLTGGKGTIIYIGIGLLIILFATVTYTITSKKKQLQN